MALFCQIFLLGLGSSVISQKCSQESRPWYGVSKSSDQVRAAPSLLLDSAKRIASPTAVF